MSSDQQPFVTVDELPDDPSGMPPPYWRGGGSWDQLRDALNSLVELLHELLRVTPEVQRQLDDLVVRSGGMEATDEFGEELRDICDPAWRIDNSIMLKCELVILMAAIHVEELINRFCVYNLPKELVETLEKLSPAEKLVAAISHLGRPRVRSHAAYAAVGELFRWRNAFAHGHCIDRPTKSLRHNHLITPDGYIGLPESIAAVIQHLKGFERIVQYLADVSVNPYTRTTVVSDVAYERREIERFQVSGTPILYDIQLQRDGA